MQTVEAMTPDTKRKAEAFTPRKRKVFLQVVFLHEFILLLITVS